MTEDLQPRGRVRHKIISFLLVSLFFIAIFAFGPIPVSADEQDEEDNFTIMPNHRWENVTETSPGVTEQLIGDYYEVNSTGTPANFIKARKLNSRHFYFETSFQVDIGTNAGYEYWEDVKGNVADFNTGSTEGWAVNSPETQISVNNGWLNCSLSSSSDYISIRADSLSINSSIYKWLNFEYYVQDADGGYVDDVLIFDYEPIPPDQVGSEASNRFTGDTVIFSENLDDDADWAGTETGFQITFMFNKSSSDHKIDINYTSLYSDQYVYQYIDGFKFGLLNEDQEEGMYFQFSRNYNELNFYNLSVDMYGENQVILFYDKTFYYDRAADGWLYLEVEWNLDKKEVKVVFAYENRSSIIKTRLLTDIYPTIGVTPLRLLELGFPSLALNNTLEPDERDIYSYVLIDYIDADWDLIEWREPDSPYSHPTWGSVSNHADTRFTSVSPYGISMYQLSQGDSYKFYSLAVNRLDGVSFDLSLETANLDTTDSGDHARFSIEMWNVQPNGTLLKHFTIELGEHYGGSLGTWCSVLNSTDDEIQRSYVNAKEDWIFDFSFYYESKDKVVLQYHWVTDTTFDIKRTYTSGPEYSESFTKEFVFVIGYACRTNQGGVTGDTIDIIMGGFDIIRKDIIGDLVSLILTPFVQILIFILTPFIILFQLLVTVILKGLSVLGDFLEPIITTMQGVIAGGIGLLQGAIEGLWEILWELAEDAANFAWDMLEFLIALIITGIQLFIDLAAVFVFTIYNFIFGGEENAPDLLAFLALLIDYIVEFIQWAYDTTVDILQLIADMTWIILVGWWFWAVFIQFARARGNPMEGLSNFIDAYFTPLINLVVIPIPQGLVFTLWLILILPNDFFFFTMMG